MSLLARLNDFTPSTVIVSQQVDDEFNQLVNILNGTTTNKDALIKFSDAANPVLRLDQISTGIIQQWLQNGTEKARIANDGALKINTTQTATPNKLAISADANNIGFVAVVQTVANDSCLRLAMEGSTNSGIPALQVSKFDGAAVQQYVKVSNSGEIRVAAGYPALIANVPTGVNVTLGGQYQQNVGTVGNVLGGQDALHSYSIAANVLANDGDSLEFIGGGTVLAAGTTKRIGFRIAGNLVFATPLFDPAADSEWSLVFTILRISSTTVIASGRYSDTAGSAAIGNSTSLGGLTFTGAITFEWMGEDTDGVSNRVVQNMSVVRKFAKGL